MIVTFHDLFVMTGEYSTPEFRARFTQQAREAAARADTIIAVSEFTASQVEALLNVERSRIRVVHHGAHMPKPAADFAAPRERIILSVGVIQARKNIARLVEAFERLPADWRLVLAGGQGYGAAQILARIERSPARARIEVAGYVPDAQLDRLYRRASIFAFPSLAEGFGIPVLEAMAYGLPVVTSNNSALREVGEGVALLVDPEQTGDIESSLRKLTDDRDLRVRLGELGKQKVQRSGWTEAARRTWEIYREGTSL